MQIMMTTVICEQELTMIKTTRAQRVALFRIFQCDFPGWLTPTTRTDGKPCPHCGKTPSEQIIQVTLINTYKASYRQNDYPTDVRCKWIDFVDRMARNGTISEALAQRATL